MYSFICDGDAACVRPEGHSAGRNAGREQHDDGNDDQRHASGWYNRPCHNQQHCSNHPHGTCPLQQQLAASDLDCAQAILSLLVFQEKIPLLWWAGAAVMTSGVVLIQFDDQAGSAAVASPGAEAAPASAPAPSTPSSSDTDSDLTPSPSHDSLRRSPRLRARSRGGAGRRGNR